jgi:hypothetical protein
MRAQGVDHVQSTNGCAMGRSAKEIDRLQLLNKTRQELETAARRLEADIASANRTLVNVRIAMARSTPPEERISADVSEH